MFRKIIINASSNLKKGLYLQTKIKSNEYLNIETEGVFDITHAKVQTNHK